MDVEQKKKRAQAVRKALLEGSEKLGHEDDYGRGLANICGSYKLINGRRLTKPGSSLFRAASILCICLVIIFFFLRLKDRNTQRAYFETYIPAETADSPSEIARPSSVSGPETFGRIVFLIRSMRYKDALAAIDDALGGKSRLSPAGTEILSLYKMIILYETGAEAKAKALANSLRPKASSALRERLDFYSGLFQ
jgi:hypothetical protein